MMPTVTSKLLFVALALMLAGSHAFTTPLPNHHHVATPTALGAFQRSSPSSDSVSFLRGERSTDKRRHHGHTDQSAEGDPPASHGIANKGEDPETKCADKPKKKGYQRAEEWDAEQKAGGMAWEQRVQFDGLRMGNQVRQNDILQRHLHSF
jgi:hypothetical protein